jgi:hypothetical protein
MAKVVLKDASITVNSVDLSTRCDQVTIEDSAEEVDVTSFQGNGYREFMQGLKDATITASFFQDFASGSVHSTLNTVYQSGNTFDVVIKADDAVVSATNPSFTMTARLYSYSPLSGSVGEPSKIEATFRNAGTGITVATS